MGSKISYFNILYVTEQRFDRAVKPDFPLNIEQINKHIKEIKEAPEQPSCTAVLSRQEHKSQDSLSDTAATTLLGEFGIWLIAFDLNSDRTQTGKTGTSMSTEETQMRGYSWRD